MRRFALALALLSAGTLPAAAQLQLPGATGAPTPVGGSGAASSGAPRSGGDGPRNSTPVAVRSPSEDTIVNRSLRLNGRQGQMVFERKDGALSLKSLVIAGEQLSRRGEACQIEVAGGPFTVQRSGRHDGLRRYDVAIESCPFTFDVMDGAIQVNVGDATTSSPLGGVCEFKQADCRGYVAGVWGPPGNSLGPNEAREIEKVRSKAESNARSNFRALLAAQGHDKAMVKTVAAEQAGFSSRRAERCADYEREDVHGFCASRVTEAWAVALRAKLNPATFERDDDSTEKRAPTRPRPKRTAVPTPGEDLPPPVLR
ncbi:hypothetical protein [Methylocella sp. CPCC 101449]|uniref:hypothetical protein n=1 Tax=Methylocella sp. CPCC 101449 TaxID=2987531 RepID=UPI00288D1755|nr:hypothetical protein [Methylocella sp. CPCC 101449]MDT2020153.1 hypothetical protein [Methylocella sp. CPCC 101449]